MAQRENSDMKEFLALRNDFPQLKTSVHGKPLVYFDNAASTLKCLPVIEALEQHYRYEVANIHRGVHFLSEQGTTKYEQTRSCVAKFLGAKKVEEIIFTKGTTDSLNLVAHTFGLDQLRPGDQIILSTMEHHSNIVPWQMVAQRTGAIIVECPITDAGEIAEETFRSLLNAKTKIVAMVHISNGMGTINPIKKFIQLAHEVGAIFVVDGAQAIAHQSVDVQDLDCDFYAFSGHKIFGPTGTGVLYGKEDLLNSMSPYQGGGDMIDVVSFQGTTYNTLPHKFEAGTPHIAGIIALKAALDYVQKIGLEKIAKYEHQLLSYATEKMQDIAGIKFIGQAKEKSAVISFTLDGAHPHDIGTLLDQQGIAIRTGHHCNQPLMKRMNVTATARASFCFYNTCEEIDIFIDGLRKIKEFL